METHGILQVVKLPHHINSYQHQGIGHIQLGLILIILVVQVMKYLEVVLVHPLNLRYGVTVSGGLNVAQTGTDTFEAQSNLANGVWYNIVLVHSSSGDTIYLNGVAKTTNTFVTVPTDTTWYLGGRANNSESLDGQMDQTSVWSVALSASEVASLYSSTSTPLASGLLSHYDFEQTGTTLEDTSVTSTVSAITLEDKSTNSVPLTYPFVDLPTDFEMNTSTTVTSQSQGHVIFDLATTADWQTDSGVYDAVPTSDDFVLNFDWERHGGDSPYVSIQSDTSFYGTPPSGEKKFIFLYANNDQDIRYSLRYDGSTQQNDVNGSGTNFASNTIGYFQVIKSGNTMDYARYGSDADRASQTNALQSTATVTLNSLYASTNDFKYITHGEGGSSSGGTLHNVKLWIGTDSLAPVQNAPTSTTGTLGTALQNPNLTYTDSNLPDNTDTFSLGGWVKLDNTQATNTKLLGVNNVIFNVGPTSASVVEVGSATFSTDFTDATGWSDPSSSLTPEITGGVMEFDSINDESYISYDLGSVSSTWVLRWQMDPTTVSSTGGSGSQTFVGLVDDVSTITNGFPVVTGVGHETWEEGTVHKTLLADPDNSWYSWTHDADTSYGFTAGTTYWIELIRTGTYTFEMNYYDNATYSGTPIMALTYTSSLANANLQYIYINTNDYANNNSSGQIGTIDNLEFYDGVTSVAGDTTIVSTGMVVNQQLTQQQLVQYFQPIQHQVVRLGLIQFQTQ